MPRATKSANKPIPGGRDKLHEQLGYSDEDWRNPRHRKDYKFAKDSGLQNIQNQLNIDLAKFQEYSPVEQDKAVRLFADTIKEILRLEHVSHRPCEKYLKGRVQSEKRKARSKKPDIQNTPAEEGERNPEPSENSTTYLQVMPVRVDAEYDNGSTVIRNESVLSSMPPKIQMTGEPVPHAETDDTSQLLAVTEMNVPDTGNSTLVPTALPPIQKSAEADTMDVPNVPPSIFFPAGPFQNFPNMEPNPSLAPSRQTSLAPRAAQASGAHQANNIYDLTPEDKKFINREVDVYSDSLLSSELTVPEAADIDIQNDPTQLLMRLVNGSETLSKFVLQLLINGPYNRVVYDEVFQLTPENSGTIN